MSDTIALEQLVVEMQAVARKHPFSTRTMHLELEKASKGEVPTRRYETIDGYDLVVQLTYNVLPSAGDCWHLSYSIRGHEPMPEWLINKVKVAFLGEEPPFLEIPSVWGPAVKQYMQKVKR